MNKINIRVASFLAVLIIYHTCYGLQTLLPTNVSWLMTVKHDWGGHYLGWLFYKNEAWHFPLGAVHDYFYPVGTNVGFTDSIPLLAIFFKLFSGILPADFQYFGIWLLLCHLLAAHYTILLFRLFKVNDVITFIAVIFVAANPVLIYRGLHPALCAHWLLIASLYVYFQDPVVVRPFKILRYQFILLMTAALVNPYLCLMVLGFSVVTAAKLGFFQKVIRKRHFFMYTGISLFSLILSWYIVGILEFGRKENVGVEGGYGLYGLNLHSLYNSFGFSTFFKGIRQVSPHQYEGFMYLGAGMFLLLLILPGYATVSWVQRMKRGETVAKRPFFKDRRLIPLYVLIGVYTLFAVSHVVTLNEKVLFRVPIPKLFIQLGDIFRAGARFFWPVYYLVFFFAIIMIARSRMRHAVKLAILGTGLILQLYDTKRMFIYRQLTYGTYEPPIDSKSWKTLMSRFDNVVIYPPFATTNLEEMDYQYFCYLAGKQGQPITTGYVARVNDKGVKQYNDTLTYMLDEGRLSPGSLYITTPANLYNFIFALQSDSAQLNFLDGYYYIFSKQKNDPVLLSLSDDINKRNKPTIDSAIQAVMQRTEFKKITDPLIAQAGGIKHNLEKFREKGNSITVGGWGFKEGTTDSRTDSVFFILKGEKDIYAAPALVQSRPDVTAHFNAQHLDNTGFSAIIFNNEVDKGTYTLGIAIKNKEGGLTYALTGKTIKVHMDEYATVQKLSAWPAMAEITSNPEKFEVDDKMISVQGWAFLKDRDATGNSIGIILKKEDEIYLALSEPMLRPDVTAHFGNKFKLDNSGFSVKILKSSLPKGTYQFGIYIKDNAKKKEGMIFPGRMIEIDQE